MTLWVMLPCPSTRREAEQRQLVLMRPLRIPGGQRQHAPRQPPPTRRANVEGTYTCECAYLPVGCATKLQTASAWWPRFPVIRARTVSCVLLGFRHAPHRKNVQTVAHASGSSHAGHRWPTTRNVSCTFGVTKRRVAIVGTTAATVHTVAITTELVRPCQRRVTGSSWRRGCHGSCRRH